MIQTARAGGGGPLKMATLGAAKPSFTCTCTISRMFPCVLVLCGRGSSGGSCRARGMKAASSGKHQQRGQLANNDGCGRPCWPWPSLGSCYRSWYPAGGKVCTAQIFEFRSSCKNNQRRPQNVPRDALWSQFQIEISELVGKRSLRQLPAWLQV